VSSWSPLFVSIGSMLWIVGAWAATGAFLGLVVAIPALLYIRRKQWLRRRFRAWNFATFFVYPYLMLVLATGGGALGGLLGAQDKIHAFVSATMTPLARSQMPTVKQWLTESVDWGTAKDMSLDEAARRVLQKLYYPPASDGWFDRQRARVINYFTLNLGKWIVSAGLGALGAYAMGRAGDTLGLDASTIRFSVDVIRELDLSRVDDRFPQMLERALAEKMDQLFEALYLKVGLLFALALLLPAVEMWIYFRWYHHPKVEPRPVPL